MWKIKKGYENAEPANINIPLSEMTQKQIGNLREEIRNAYFYDKPDKRKRKQSNNDSKRKGHESID
jgi:hypothetical protein